MISFKGFLGIGDLTLVGWLTVILYFSTAISCWITARKIRLASADVENAREQRAWRSIAAAFLALGISTLVDFQAALTETGRVFAKVQGWYEHRRCAQIAFVVVVAVICLIIAIVLVRWARNAPVSTWSALAGSTMLIGYVVIRAASFHDVDRLIYSRSLGFRLNWILETGAIGVVLVASYWRRSKIGKSKPGSLPRS